MVAVQVFGNDAATTFAGSQGNFELTFSSRDDSQFPAFDEIIA